MTFPIKNGKMKIIQESMVNDARKDFGNRWGQGTHTVKLVQAGHQGCCGGIIWLTVAVKFRSSGKNYRSRDSFYGWYPWYRHFVTFSNRKSQQVWFILAGSKAVGESIVPLAYWVDNRRLLALAFWRQWKKITAKILFSVHQQQFMEIHIQFQY